MRLRNWGLVALLLFPCCVVAAAVADDPDADLRAKIDAAVKLLGAEDAKTRDDAVRRLVALGEKARSAVEKALADSDGEVRERARNVIALLDDAARAKTAADQTWPGLRGGPSRSGVSSGELPRQTPKLAWATPLYERALIQGAVVPAGDYVATLSGTGTVRAFSTKDGGRLWAADLPGGITASAALAGDRLVVPTGKGLVALDAKDGRVAWRFDASYGCDAAPAIVGRRVYAAFKNLALKGFDLATGEELFTKALAPAGALLADADLLVCGTQDGSLLRVDVETGKPKWKLDLGAAPNMGPTLAAPGVVVVFSRDRYLRAVRTEDGKELWKRRESNASGSESLGAAAGRIFLTDRGGWISSFDALSGKLLWKRNEGFVEMGGPCATATSVIVASRGRLVCRDADCGDYLWRLDVASRDNAAPSAAAGRVYVLYDDELRCYE